MSLHTDSPLTPREKTVLGLVSKGYTSKQISMVLCRSEHTIRCHMKSVLHKLGASTRAEAAVHAAKQGWV